MRITGRILSVQVGLPRMLGNAGSADTMDSPWESGIYKAKVEGPVWVGKTNLAGDGQSFEEHGGPDKAVFVFASENHGYWQQELGLADAVAGSQGENLTTSGLLESNVCIGDIFLAGEVRFQVSQPRQPCWKVARRNANQKELPVLMEKTARSGWYFRVLQEGTIEAGVSLDLLERPAPAWSVERAFLALRDIPETQAAARELAALQQLSRKWRDSLLHCLARGKADDPFHRLYGPIVS
jgi:MOSC domain-containing protein YiiM